MISLRNNRRGQRAERELDPRHIVWARVACVCLRRANESLSLSLSLSRETDTQIDPRVRVACVCLCSTPKNRREAVARRARATEFIFYTPTISKPHSLTYTYCGDSRHLRLSADSEFKIITYLLTDCGDS
jgi:hypothetical protein